jgi:hypothetical protein
VVESGVASTIVKSTQFDEFAANQVAVKASADEVSVQDWLIQPIVSTCV